MFHRNDHHIEMVHLFWTVTSTFFKLGVKEPSEALVTFCDKALVPSLIDDTDGLSFGICCSDMPSYS